jgi:UDP-2,4-diacetamido-2,4,6-trideoxy-beta-L-altropyranose hydrolase
MSTLVIRADATLESGTGHVMRCLALAQAWQDKGGEVIFISRCSSNALRQRLSAEGIDLISLDKPHPDPVDWNLTKGILVQLQGREPNAAPWLVVDGYHFDAKYQKSVKAAGYKLLWIDDYGQAEHYYADLVLNQNISADASCYVSRESYTQLLMGPRYTLLRREFKRWQGWRRDIPEIARKVLVTLGGADPDNVTQKVIKALMHADIPELEARIVVGSANPHLELLRQETRGDSRIHLLANIADMSDLLAWADVSISGGGSTCWELAFMGLPGLIITLADNQRPVSKWLGQMGIDVDLGWHASLSSERLARETFKILASPSIREKMSAKGRRLIDGDGAARVLMSVKGEEIRLRRVRDDDCLLLWQWANDGEVRDAAYSTAAIPWEDHLHWFTNKKSDPGCLQFIAVDGQDRPVGQVRFDIQEGDSAEIDVSVDREKRGLGYGKLILEMAAEELFQNTPVRSINSFIKISNIKSIRAFERAGYERVDSLNMHGEPSLYYLKQRGN